MPEPTTPTLRRVMPAAPAERRVARPSVRVERELHGAEAVVLGHGGLGAVQDVVAQRARRSRAGVSDAVHVAGALAVGEEEVVAAGAALDVHVLAELDGALGADQEEAAVAPDRRAVGRHPVDADEAGGVVGGDGGVAVVVPAGRARGGRGWPRPARGSRGRGRAGEVRGTARTGARRCRRGSRRRGAVSQNQSGRVVQADPVRAEADGAGPPGRCAPSATRRAAATVEGCR